MLKSHEKFHSANGKRLILIIEDEWINREMLRNILESEYEILFAEDGEQGLQMIREYREVLSIVLLDLILPKMLGMDLLKLIKNDPNLQNLPVIVMTSEQQAEVETLRLGASDFIPKPFVQPEVILARVLRTIELYEDRQIIQSTERDTLTGLYNREYFYRYAEQYDQYHKDAVMDAMVIDVNHFHMINERYGKAYGDDVLRRIAGRLKEMVSDGDGIVCRREADTFLIYCPHGKDYQEILDYASVGLSGDSASSNNRIRLRMGVYPEADKTIDIERRFDRAKLAADTVRSNFSHAVGIYNNTLHESEIYAEQLLEDFHEALEEEQFIVFYQPKFDIRPEIPMLASAEALVRWQHPKLGMISPGIFIPLFEDNGLIQQLDHYVWRVAARQIREWKDRFGISVPVSVNVSRIDMYDAGLVDRFRNLMREFDLDPSEYLLEITESAYTQDSAQIIETVNQLRELGFKIEMDDFGTGYSSLNMLSSLPIDALKLDMRFIRNAFQEGRNTRMLEAIIDIADYLGVPVIAEGVETVEQLHALKKMGCSLVQGYYFSRPVPPFEYERFVQEKRDRVHETLPPIDVLRPTPVFLDDQSPVSYMNIAHALTSGFESIYYVDIETDHYVEFSSRGKYEDLQIERSGTDFFSDTQRNLKRVIFPEDQSRVSASMEKETLLSQLRVEDHFSMTYRLMIEGVPTYYNLKAVMAIGRDAHHVVIGVSNVDELMRQAMGYEEVQARSAEFFSIAQALSCDFESIYYVDTETDDYTEFTSQGSYEELKIHTSGTDFFAETQRNLLIVVYAEDQPKVSMAMEKEQLLKTLEENQVFTLDYRLMINGVPTYYRLKAVPAESGDDHHIVIGVSNISAQVVQEHALETARKNSVTYAQIAHALAQDYFSIYYVDMETDHFLEYSATDQYRELHIEQSGENFFEVSRQNIRRVVYEPDREKALQIWDKDNILAAIAEDNSFSTSYRLLVNEVPVFVNIKVMRMPNQETQHIIVGISNIDAQMKREKEFAEAQALALKDALTGVKNKHAYTQHEKRLDDMIGSGEAPAFAVAVCDVNGLKTINDTYGHKTGDQYIREACTEICHTFQHSPVFRIGGDEFAVILTGSDFENRGALYDRIQELNRLHEAEHKVIIACGIADFDKDTDTHVASVFVRADEAMYENKTELKTRPFCYEP